MSGSDLAPFVAAVLRDEVVAEMKNKIDELHSERFLVQITGINGTPIHYKGSMKNGGRCGEDHWCVPLDENDAVSSLTILNNFEIWLCGILVHKSRRHSLVIASMSNFKENDNESSNLGMGSIRLISATAHFPPVVHSTYGTIGPMLRADYEELTGMMNLTQLMDLRHNGTALGINIEYIMFNRKNVRGTLALLEKLGTDTMEPLVGGPPSPALTRNGAALAAQRRAEERRAEERRAEERRVQQGNNHAPLSADIRLLLNAIAENNDAALRHREQQPHAAAHGRSINWGE